MKQTSILIFFLLFSQSLISVDTDLVIKRDCIHIGEPLVIRICLYPFEPSEMPEHKLLINGNPVPKTNPYWIFFSVNSLIKDEAGKKSLSFESPLFVDDKAGFMFDKEGEYKIALEFSGKKIEKSIKVLPVTETENSAFEKYKEKKNQKHLLGYLFGEWDGESFRQAEATLKEFPKSTYSKLAALYYVTQRQSRGFDMLIEKNNIKLGDKVDMKKLKSDLLEMQKENEAIISSFDFKGDGFIEETAALLIIRNNLIAFSIKEMPIDPVTETEIKKKLEDIKTNTVSKFNLVELKKLEGAIAEFKEELQGK